jgi:hypothetical protein
VLLMVMAVSTNNCFPTGANHLPGKRSKVSSAETSDKSTENTEEKKAALTLIMECADELLSIGATEIYSATREQLANSTCTWEYHGQENAETIHGPFTAEQIINWRAQGYFVGPTAVQMRPVGGNDDDWVSSDSIEFVDLPQLKIISSRALPMPEDDDSEEDIEVAGKKARNVSRGRPANSSSSTGFHKDDDDEEDDDDDDDGKGDSEAEADDNLRGKRTRGNRKTGGRKYTSKDDSDSDADI